MIFITIMAISYIDLEPFSKSIDDVRASAEMETSRDLEKVKSDQLLVLT